MKLRAAVLAVFFALLAGACSSDVGVGESAATDDRGVSEIAGEPTATAAPTATPVPLTPAEIALACLDGAETDEVACQGARAVTVGGNEQLGEAYSRLDECEAEGADCAGQAELVRAALQGQNIEALLGPAPGEVWQPDVEAIQLAIDDLNLANDVTGRIGHFLAYFGMNYPGIESAPEVCLGADVDAFRPVLTVDQYLNEMKMEVLVDVESIRRTDDWRLVSPYDPAIKPLGRTYAFRLTTAAPATGPFDAFSDEVEVHATVRSDGRASLFFTCDEDNITVINPNDTNVIIEEGLLRLEQAGVWRDDWQRPGKL